MTFSDILSATQYWLSRFFYFAFFYQVSPVSGCASRNIFNDDFFEWLIKIEKKIYDGFVFFVCWRDQRSKRRPGNTKVFIACESQWGSRNALPRGWIWRNELRVVQVSVYIVYYVNTYLPKFILKPKQNQTHLSTTTSVYQFQLCHEYFDVTSFS